MRRIYDPEEKVAAPTPIPEVKASPSTDNLTTVSVVEQKKGRAKKEKDAPKGKNKVNPLLGIVIQCVLQDQLLLMLSFQMSKDLWYDQ